MPMLAEVHPSSDMSVPILPSVIRPLPFALDLPESLVPFFREVQHGVGAEVCHLAIALGPRVASVRLILDRVQQAVEKTRVET